MSDESYSELVRFVKEREAAAEQRGDAAATLRAQSAYKALQAELETARAQHGASSRKAQALEVQVARLRKVISDLTEPGDPVVVVDPPKGDPDPPVDPLPGGSDDGSSIINAHDYLGRTAEQNLTIPRFDWLRANRAPRTKRVGTRIFKPNEVHRIENEELYAEWASCIGFTYDHPQHRQAKVEIVNVGHNMQPGAKQPTKWGERCWSMSQIHRVDCDYTRIPEEHGTYDNPSGSTSHRRSTAIECGGHHVYICLRNQPTLKADGTQQYPPNNAVPTAPTTHLIEDSHSRNMNNRAAKGSNDIELFNLGTRNHQATILIRDSSSVVAFPHQLHTGTGQTLAVGVPAEKSYVRSYGDIVVKTYQDQIPTYDETPTYRHPVKLLHIKNRLSDYTQANKDIMSLNDCEKIVLEGGSAIARQHRQPYIDIDGQLDQGHEPCDEVVVADYASEGVKVRWNMPDGRARLFELETRGKFVRLVRNGSEVTMTEEPYDPAHRAKQMDSAGA